MVPGNSLIRTERKSGLNQTNVYFINYFSFYNLVTINLDKLKIITSVETIIRDLFLDELHSTR